VFPLRLSVTLEERFLQTPDGAIWSGFGGTAGYSFWRRYLDIFDEVTVVARVGPTSQADDRWRRADGEGVTFHGVPHYVGPVAYALRYFGVRRKISTGLAPGNALIMRVPSVVGSCLDSQLPHGRPFGLEVLGDVYDIFAPGAIDHPLRPFLRRWFTSNLQRQCRRACAIAYVSRETLQRRYPPAKTALSIGCSDVELPESAFVHTARIYDGSETPFRIVSIGTMEVSYKGFDTLIDATALCAAEGLDINLVMIGEGRHRPELAQRVQVRGLIQQVKFTGRLFGPEELRKEMDQAHIFALASKTEGLPRAMIEAMARALPCVGTSVGAIPELLPREALFSREDVDGLARLISALARDPEMLSRMSARNLAAARDYHSTVLKNLRREFYQRVKEATEEWNRAQGLLHSSDEQLSRQF
jgi:glycosyltransferase involved in cell wall biosynthesis